MTNFEPHGHSCEFDRCIVASLHHTPQACIAALHCIALQRCNDRIASLHATMQRSDCMRRCEMRKRRFHDGFGIGFGILFADPTKNALNVNL
jgi:hypothetical protein